MNNHNTSHGACGKTWRQRGNTTGLCAGCHETFEGRNLFNAHFERINDTPVCRNPETLEYPKGWPLKLVNGSWRSTKPHPRALTQ